MLKVGIAGIGFMGWIHYLAYQNVRGIGVTAICSRDKKKLKGDWRSIKGNFGPPGEKIDVAEMKAYSSLDELLSDPDIDIVDNCLPPHLHAEVSIRALRAGKHVFCEKPMALTIADCKRMESAAKKADRQVLIGHVLPFFPEYVQARKWIDSGAYGRLLGGSFTRVISDPLWLADFYDPARVGGPLVDLHVHDAHFIRLLFGMPVSLISHGRMRGEVVEYCQTAFQFQDPDVVVTAKSGVINQQGRGFTHGYEIHLERATMHFEYAAFADGKEEIMPLKLLNDKGKVLRPKLPGAGPTAAFEAEIKEVMKAVRSGGEAPILSSNLARDAIALCHKQTESVKKRRSVKVS